MKLDLVKKLVFALVIAVFVASCMNEANEDYSPPTLEEELDLLSEYIDTLHARGFDIDTTDMGIYYSIDSIGDGAFPYDGDTMQLTYEGFFMDGNIFDRSSAEGVTVIAGQGILSDGEVYPVIDGWNYGLTVFNKGGRGFLILPSEFAYGSEGYPNGYGGYSIPPYTSLIFRINVLDVKFAN